MHTNTTTLITGETLYYKLYCLLPSNSKSSTISKIAYVELIESNKQNVFKHKLYLEKGTAQGDFFVPTLKSGNYKLIAYTNWMLNKPSSEIRYQLLWTLELTLENTVSFYSSDVKGTFEIIVEGFTDKGIPISLKETFQVN